MEPAAAYAAIRDHYTSPDAARLEFISDGTAVGSIVYVDGRVLDGVEDIALELRDGILVATLKVSLPLAAVAVQDIRRVILAGLRIRRPRMLRTRLGVWLFHLGQRLAGI